jgi:hypothetical protein
MDESDCGLDPEDFQTRRLHIRHTFIQNGIDSTKFNKLYGIVRKNVFTRISVQINKTFISLSIPTDDFKYISTTIIIVNIYIKLYRGIMCAWWIIRLNTIFLDGKRVPT